MRKKRSFSYIKDKLLLSDLSAESIGGATNSVAALGNGSLTVGISAWSELVYFRWPYLSFYDHLNYYTKTSSILSVFTPKDVRHGIDAPCDDWYIYGRPLEKEIGLGAKFGIFNQESGIQWADNPIWISERKYIPDWSHVLETTLTNMKNNKLKIKITQALHNFDNVLIQSFKFENDELNKLSNTKFIYYANFAPWYGRESGMSKCNPQITKSISLFIEDLKIILWFCPKKSKLLYSKLKKRIIKEKLNLTENVLKNLIPYEGIFISMASNFNIQECQIGNARNDAEDGSLRKNNLDFGKICSGFCIPIEKNDNCINVYIAIGNSFNEVVDLIKKYRKKDINSIFNEISDEWKKFAQKIFIPKEANQVEKRVATRSIMNLFIGKDKNTNAIVASPSRQPHYNCDWPRDGAFFDLALDLAGFSDIVTKHLEFYRKFQRKTSFDFSPTWILSFKNPFYNPKGHFYSNMWSDGSPGWFKMVPIEIDETALIVWDIWRHEQFLDEKDKILYRNQFKEMLELAVEGILNYIDVKKGWIKKVMEDDDFRAKATLHGVSIVYTAICAAIELADRWYIEKSKLELWKLVANNLKKGILDQLNLIYKEYSKDKNLKSENIEKLIKKIGGWRGIQWCLFPAPVFKDYNNNLSQMLIEILANDITQKANKIKEGFAYLAEEIFIFSIATKNNQKFNDLKKTVLKILIEETPVKGTDCFGEVVLWLYSKDGKSKFAQNRTSIPHLWTGATVYLSVLGTYCPELFLNLRPFIKTIN